MQDGGCVDPALVFDGRSCVDESIGVAECRKLTVGAKFPIDSATCGIGCICSRCTPAILQCGADPHGYCMTILGCMLRAECSGVSCYSPSTCQAVIDAAPGGGLTSLSVALAIQVSDCTGTSACSLSCAPPLL
ncbi:MAG TPA: hypothetical protein VHE30_28440 [Polyangiaceae bacterium]|nr:hypothetical protein [Polyangiaceae bacterium]